MSPVARTIFIYAIYVLGLGATLLLAPNVPLPLFGLPQASEVWIRVAGMTVIFLSIFYFTAARNEYRKLFETSVWIRFAVAAGGEDADPESILADDEFRFVTDVSREKQIERRLEQFVDRRRTAEPSKKSPEHKVGGSE